MKLFASTLILLFLLLLSACSTRPVLKTSQVIYLQPSAGLLTPCSPPSLRPSETNRDLVDNSLARQSAFDACNIRMTCLIEWHEAAPIAAAEGKAVPSLSQHCGHFE